MAALAEAGEDWDLRGIYVRVLAGTAVAPRNSTWLDAWLEAEPTSPDAAAVHAESLAFRAWDARGGASASATSHGQFQRFHRILRTCADEAMRAADLAPKDPTPWSTMVTAARRLQFSNIEFERIWQELLIRDPANRRAHLQALDYWQPKWFGSRELADRFVEDTAARLPHSALAFQLRLDNQLTIWLPRSPKIDQAAFFRRSSGRRPLRDALDDYWTGTIPTGGGQAVLDRHWLAWALTMANRWDEACKVWFELGGGLVAGQPWLFSLNSAEFFTELRREAFIMSSLKPSRQLTADGPAR